jgi:hypothetical protein
MHLYVLEQKTPVLPQQTFVLSEQVRPWRYPWHLTPLKRTRTGNEDSIIQLWSWPTPNGQKIHIALEELELPYRIVPINIGKGEQFQPEFLAMTAGNHRIPAIVDRGRALRSSATST